MVINRYTYSLKSNFTIVRVLFIIVSIIIIAIITSITIIINYYLIVKYKLIHKLRYCIILQKVATGNLFYM